MSEPRQHLLSGLLYCGECGQREVHGWVEGQPYYCCDTVGCDKTNPIDADVLDALVWDLAWNSLMNSGFNRLVDAQRKPKLSNARVILDGLINFRVTRTAEEAVLEGEIPVPESDLTMPLRLAKKTRGFIAFKDNTKKDTK